MKKIIILLVITYVSIIYAQERLNIAIVELRAGIGRTQSQVDGLADMLTVSLFETGLFTIKERTQVDKIVQERNYQGGNLSQTQIRSLGTELSVDALLLGTINFQVTDRTVVDVLTDMAGGEYSIDIRLVSVQSGELLSAAGGQVYSGQTERNLMRLIANELAENYRMRNKETQAKTVHLLYDYLYVYPEDLGSFSSFPQTVITALNRNNTYGFTDWRLPNLEERDLLIANRHTLGLVSNSTYAHHQSFNVTGTYTVRLVRSGVLVQQQSSDQQTKPYFQNDVYNFGSVPVLNNHINASFILQNPTNASIRITRVETLVSWITADWTRDNISSGNSGTVNVRVSLSGRQNSSIDRRINVILNNGERLTVNVRGQVN